MFNKYHIKNSGYISPKFKLCGIVLFGFFAFQMEDFIMLKKIINNTMVKDIVAIVIGCIITAFAINNILVPNALSTSGITGLALIAQKYTGINYTYMYYVFSIIILISSLIFLGKKDFLKILFVSIFYPTLLLCMNSIGSIRDFVFEIGRAHV